MSDTPDNTLQTDELTAQVDELLEEIDRQADAVESRMNNEDALSEEVQGILADTGVVEPAGAEPEVDAAPGIDKEAAPPSEEVSETVEHEALVEQLLEESESLISQDEEAPASEFETETEAADGSSQEPGTDLDADVEALLQEAESELESAGSSAAEPEVVASELDDDIEALIESVSDEEATVEPEVTPEVTEEPAPVEEPVGEVESAVADLEDEVSSVEELDEELAAEAEDAIEHQLEGEIETVDLGAVIEQEALGDDSEVPEPVAEVPAKPVAEEVSSSEATAVSPVSVSASDSKAKNMAGGVVLLIERVLQTVSRPLAGLTPRQRDTIGWVALNVLFIAVCVWLVVLMR